MKKVEIVSIPPLIEQKYINSIEDKNTGIVMYFWASESRYIYLIDNGYTEIKSKTYDREVLIVNTSNKTFEMADKHVNKNYGEYMEDIKFMLKEEGEQI